MRPLDDILIGFFIFFAIDRLIRLFSNTVVAGGLRAQGATEESIENWKMGAEAVILVMCIILVWRYRYPLARLNKM
jgi:predicted benzoate:H+ symporter BenE